MYSVEIIALVSRFNNAWGVRIIDGLQFLPNHQSRIRKMAATRVKFACVRKMLLKNKIRSRKRLRPYNHCYYVIMHTGLNTIIVGSFVE